MKTKTIVQGIAYLTIIVAMAVAFGWIFDITLLKSIMPDYVPMKIVTSSGFFLAGFIILLLQSNKTNRNKVKTLYLCILSFLLLLIMFVYLYYNIYNIQILSGNVITGSNKVGNVIDNSIYLDRPSLVSMLSFILIGMVASTHIFNLKNNQKIQIVLGLIITFLGLIALIGYILNKPILFYYSGELNTGMPLQSSILFVLIGIGIYLIGKEKSI